MDAKRWAEIRASFDELVELRSGERAARLSALAASDPELRAAVEGLLRADAAADARLGDVECAVDAFGLAGTTISHFRLIEPIGAGGMGVVYRAEDTRLGRAVALKFLLPLRGGDAVWRRRLLHEARAAASLDHPNLCTIHEIGESEDGRPFIAMALYEGETLKARLERTPRLGVPEAVKIARQVASGLACAHAAGIVHRDLKPGNLMLLPDDSVKVLDFGLAKARDESLTASTERLGTVAYMAPEQVRGDPVDARADLWALGVTCHEMLAGARPFAGDHAVSIAHAILHDEPPRLSAERADLPPALEAIVLGLLEKDPARRYGSAEQLRRDLDAARDGATITRGRRLPRWPPARRAAIAGVVAIAALLGGESWRRAARGASPSIRALAVLPIATDSSHTPVADDLHLRLVDELSRVRALRVTGGTTSARELGADALLASSLTPAAGDSLFLHVRLRGGKTGEQLWAKHFAAGARRADRLQLDVARELVAYLRVPLTPEERRRLAPRREADPRADEAYRRGARMLASFDPQRFQKSIAAFEEAIALDPDEPGPHVALAEAYQGMVGAGHAVMSRSEAFLRATEHVRRALQLDPDDAEAHVVLGGILHMWDWDWAGAEREFALAIRIDPGSARAHWQFGAYLRSIGRLDSAIAELHRARRIDPLLTINLAELALAYVWAGRADSGIHWGRAARDLEPNSAPVRWALGAAFKAAGRHDSSLVEHLRAAELNPQFRIRLAQAYAAAGRTAEFDRLVASLPEAHRRIAIALSSESMGERDAAIASLGREITQHAPFIGSIRGEPAYEHLVADARYQALLRRLELPPRRPRGAR